MWRTRRTIDITARFRRASRMILSAAEYNTYVHWHVLWWRWIIFSVSCGSPLSLQLYFIFYLAARRRLRLSFLEDNTQIWLVAVLRWRIFDNHAGRRKKLAYTVQPGTCRSSHYDVEGTVYDIRTPFSVFVAKFPTRQFSFFNNRLTT